MSVCQIMGMTLWCTRSKCSPVFVRQVFERIDATTGEEWSGLEQRRTFSSANDAKQTLYTVRLSLGLGAASASVDSVLVLDF